MGQAAKTGTKRTKKRASPRSVGEAEPRVPPGLARTSVYKRVPITVRSRLDGAILLRPQKCATLKAIAEKFKLSERYGVTLTALRSYAGKLEQLVRPVLTSQLIAGVLGCLPEHYRQQLVAGNQVLLLSRVAQALSGEGALTLPVADVAKLASILSAVAGRTTAARTTAARTTPAPSPAGRTRTQGAVKSKEADIPISATDPTKMAEAVRMLYGLSWPPPEASEEKQNR